MTEMVLAACTGKSAFPSKNAAASVAKRMRRKHSTTVDAYRCQACGQWHVGAPEPRPHKREAAQRATTPAKPAMTPTRERLERGEWVAVGKGHDKLLRDIGSVPVDRLEHAGVLSNHQASAARQFEELYRAANEAVTARDSCTIWEPKGHDEGDGPVKEARDRRELYLFLGMAKDQALRRVCVEHVEPRGVEIGILREALNECVRFFRT